MTPEELLSTTRSVRRRLDFERAVPRELVLDCLQLALQAPTGSNRQSWHWLIITDPDKKRFIGERYRDAWYAYNSSGRAEYPQGDPRREQTPRVVQSAKYLADRMGEVPLMVLPCIEGRVDGGSNLDIAGLYGSILAGDMELHASREAARPRQRLYNTPPQVRGGSRKRAGDSVPAGHPGRAAAGGLTTPATSSIRPNASPSTPSPTGTPGSPLPRLSRGTRRQLVARPRVRGATISSFCDSCLPIGRPAVYSVVSTTWNSTR